MITRILVILFVLYGVTACQKIHFVNGDADIRVDSTEWHHVGVFGIMELSRPIDFQERCEGDWNSITSKATFVDWLAGSVDNLVGLDIWQPWTVQYSCK